MIKITDVMAVDCESTGLDIYAGDRPFMISFTNELNESEEVHFAVNPYTRKIITNPRALARAKEICEDENITKIFHNANFDIGMLGSVGVDVLGTIFDTIVMAHCANSGRRSYALKPLAEKLLGISTEDEKALKKAVISARRKAKKKGWKIAEDVKADYWLAMDFACVYAKFDTERTMGLYKLYKKKYDADENYRNLVDMEMILLDVIRRMSTKGITVDFERLLVLKDYYEKIVSSSEKEQAKMGYADLNPRSSKQMQEIFYGKLKLPVEKRRRKDKKTGKMKFTPSCDAKALEKWSESVPLAKLLVNTQTASHELSAFVLPFQELSKEDGLLHPTYITCGPITGRISCTKPNLMNISNSGIKSGDVELRVRELFIPRKGHVFYFPDYSQIEVWLAAYISKDKIMMDALAGGLDMHKKFADNFFGDRKDYEERKEYYRKRTKIATFATLYGGGAPAIMQTASLSENEAANFQQEFRGFYKELHQYSRDLARMGEKFGFIVDNFGRNYPITKDEGYKALNYMIQGSAAGVMKRALINVDGLFRVDWPGAELLLNIHDELGIEVPMKYHSKKLMRDIIKAMQGNFHTYFGMPRPFDVSMAWTATRWNEKKEIEL